MLKASRRANNWRSLLLFCDNKSEE